MSVGVYFELTGSTSRSVLHSVRQHEPAARERFVKFYAPTVYGWCDAMDATGFIGLQVHRIKSGAGPYGVRRKNIELRELKPDDKVE